MAQVAWVVLSSVRIGRRPRVALGCGAIVATLLAATACGGPEGSSADPAGVAAAAVERADWTVDSVVARLVAAGLHAVRSPEPVRQPFLSVDGTLLRLDHADLHLYVYADSAARLHDTHRLDPHTVALPHASVHWSAAPTLIARGNVAAIVLTDHPAVRDRVHHALTAHHPGAPPPPPPPPHHP